MYHTPLALRSTYPASFTVNIPRRLYGQHTPPALPLTYPAGFTVNIPRRLYGQHTPPALQSNVSFRIELEFKSNFVQQ